MPRINKVSAEVQQNRDLFLDALRSGKYPKGPIETDSRGRPSDPHATGYCAVGLAHTLFCGDSSFRHMAILIEMLDLKPTQFRRIQQEWNDSPLTFPEIADRIESEMFHE